MNRSGRGLLLMLLGVLALGAMLTACGGGGSSSDSGTTAAETEPAETEPAETEPTETAEGGAGVEAAKELVAKYKPGQPLEIAALAKKPPTGVTVAEVNCNTPNCLPEGMKEPVESLGWKYEPFIFDVEKGPQDYTRQFEAALAAHPDYISTTLTFGDEVSKPLLEKAKQDGIPVVGVVAREKNPAYIGIIQGPNSQALAMGEATAALAISEVGAGVHAAIATDPSLPLLEPTLEGMEKQIEENGEDGATAESFEVSLTKTPQQNVAGVISYLQGHPEVNVLMFTATTFATGAYQQLKTAGILDKVKVFVPYASPADLPAIKSGEVSGGLAGEQNYAWRTTDMMARVAAGEEVEEFEPIGQFRTLGPENATEEELDPPNYKSVYEKAWQVEG